jgi:hypothetical protein
MKTKLDPDLVREAKAIVALAFRNGPLEDLHAGTPCPTCIGNPDISHISQEEMKQLMKTAVDVVYRFLWQRDYDPQSYAKQIAFGNQYTRNWDDPHLKLKTQKRNRL